MPALLRFCTRSAGPTWVATLARPRSQLDPRAKVKESPCSGRRSGGSRLIANVRCMRAIQVTSLDGPKAVQLVDVPEPDPGAGVLVDVHIAGVNFPDVLMSRGEYQMKPELPFVPGSEVAGTRVDTGQRVAGFSVLGGYAEKAVCDPATLFALPDNVSFEAGAALLMNYLTVDFALVRRADLQPGQTVLVHGAAGGIGVATIQLAKVLGARVIAVVSTEEKGEV